MLHIVFMHNQQTREECCILGKSLFGYFLKYRNIGILRIEQTEHVIVEYMKLREHRKRNNFTAICKHLHRLRGTFMKPQSLLFSLLNFYIALWKRFKDTVVRNQSSSRVSSPCFEKTLLCQKASTAIFTTQSNLSIVKLVQTISSLFILNKYYTNQSLNRQYLSM